VRSSVAAHVPCYEGDEEDYYLKGMRDMIRKCLKNKNKKQNSKN
jgi:hypothetical protein